MSSTTKMSSPHCKSFQHQARLVLGNRLVNGFNAAFSLFSGQGARQGYLAAIDQALISLSNFLATILLARSASPTELGVYGVGFTVLRLVRSIQEGITIQPMSTFGAAMEQKDFREYATNTSMIQIAFALISAISVAFVGWALTASGNDVAGPTLFALWPAFLWWQLQEYIRRMMYTRGQVLQAALNTLVANCIRLGLMAWWATKGALNGSASLYAIAWGSLAALLPGLWQTRAHWVLPSGGVLQTWKRNWDFGRWMLGGALANWVSVEFYPVLTAGMVSFAAAGAYRALQNLVAPIHLLLRAMDTFLTPRAAKSYQERGMQALWRMMRLSYLVAGVPILGVIAVAVVFPRPLLHFLYGETYLEYAGAMTLMGVFYGLLYAYWPLQTAFKALRLSRPIFIANIIAIVSMFTVGLWMIHLWGVFGTIGGQVLNSLIVALVLWVAWNKLRHNVF